MSNFTPVPTQPVGQPVEPSAPQVEQQGQEQPLTRAELQAILQEQEQKLQRIAQSQADRSTAGLRRQIEAQITEIKQRGEAIGAPEAIIQRQVEQAWQRYIEGEFVEDDDEPMTSGPTEEQRQQVSNQIIDLAEEYNVPALNIRDPEYKTLNLSEPDPVKFMAQYTAAFQQKALRKLGPEAANRILSNPDARAPMAAVGQQTGELTVDQITTQLQALQRKTNRTPADWANMKALEERLRSKL